jgi:DNA-3-methyladenine glycosylase
MLMRLAGHRNRGLTENVSMPLSIDPAFFARPAIVVAPDLVGVTMLVDGVGGVIVECEAYDGLDPASHSFKMRKTARNAAMFGPPAHAYVYRSYGIHWCLNFVCGERDGHAVLIRALDPTHGIACMQTRRETEDVRLLCRGPGRLCEALGVTRELDGQSLLRAPFRFLPRADEVHTIKGPRIGLSRGERLIRRFGLRGSAFLSRRF